MPQMHVHNLDLTNFHAPAITPFPITRKGWDTSPDGHRIGFTNYYMTYDGKPFFGVSAEFHYSRLDERLWDKELAKLADAGVNIISTYIFWNHHEEEKGVWNFSGRRNLRRFVKLCARHGLFVIVRIGPFDHGEVRNGGVPDWVFSQPCEARSTDPRFLDLVRDLYGHIADQLHGLYFKDGGPVIAAQLDNEYMHSSAPWEFLAGVTEEWVPGGHEGFAYITALRQIAEKVGISVPFYTNTGWGGAPVPDDVLPLWGGYSYRPWLFYSKSGTHPLTDEYLYRNYHSDDVPRSEEFDPSYAPSSKPYACCEMGGGMMVSYKYRFVIPMKSVDAMANVKMASGCNFLGYYMLQGGSNPIGAKTYMNENQVAKVSYDYQAPFGEFGQVRQSARRLRLLHLFATSFASQLVPLPVTLPSDQVGLDQHDLTSLRWSVRSDGQRGFVFIDNFQDHATMPAIEGQSIDITLAESDEDAAGQYDAAGQHIRFDNISLASGENCILPFNMDLDGVLLAAATVQPVTVIKPANGVKMFVFLRPRGMKDAWMRFADGQLVHIDHTLDSQEFTVTSGNQSAHILVLSRDMADRMTVMRASTGSDGSAAPNGDVLVFAKGGTESSELSESTLSHETICDDVPAVYTNRGELVAQTRESGVHVSTWPEDALTRSSAEFEAHSSSATNAAISVHQLHADRWIITIPDELFDTSHLDELMLRIGYRGDIGWLFAGTQLLDDNFCNGDTWEIGLRQYRRQIVDVDNKLVLAITPLKKGSSVNVESAMAARMESSKEQISDVDTIECVPVRLTKFQRKGFEGTEGAAK